MHNRLHSATMTNLAVTSCTAPKFRENASPGQKTKIPRKCTIIIFTVV